MADKKEGKSDEQEKKIPVFTVLKNNAILKNIFVLDNPPSISGPKSIESIENDDQSVQETEETLLVGRHPDCNIRLEHPSISRFHLRIHSKPSSLKLSVVDLSSVHGTWVLEKKIEPGVRVQLNEGDSIQLGGSSRVYRLHWVPLSRAYDLDSPFVSPLDVLAPAEEKEETHQEDENCLSVVNNSIQSLGNDLEGMESLYSDVNSEMSLENVIPSAPPLPEYLDSSFSGEEKSENMSPLRKDCEQSEILSPCPGPLARESVNSFLAIGIAFSETENQQFEKESQNPETRVVSEVLSESKRRESRTRSEPKSNLVGNFKPTFSENQCSSTKTPEKSKISSPSYQPLPTESLNSYFPSGIVLSTIEYHQDDKENPTSESLFGTELSGKQDPESPLREDQEQSEISSLWSGALVTKSLNSSMPGGNVLSEIECQKFEKENRTPQAPSATGLSQRENPESPPIRSELKSCLHSIWSRQGKPASVLQIQTGRSRGSSTRVDINAKFEPLNHEDIENKLISKALFADLHGDEEESFTPDNENFTPNTLLLRSMKKLDQAEEIEHYNSHRSSSLKNIVKPNIQPEEDTLSFSSLRSIWSRRGKPAGVLQIQTGRSRGSSTGVDINAEFEPLNHEDIENKLISKALFADLHGDEEESFTPDKENFTPNTLLLRSMKKLDQAEEIKHYNSHRSSSLKNLVKPNIQPEEDTLSFTDKENQTPKVLQERKSGRPASRIRARLEPEMTEMKGTAERLPFQPLPVNSIGKSKSEASVHSATTSSSNSMNCAQTLEKVTRPPFNNSTRGEKRKWNMVVDSTCLLNKESRKALQLLQGLKGTQLIIPRIVIRELDCMKRRGSLFRKTTEVCSALKWIEECMVNTNCWIHVQTSVEEGRPIAPTPPASPQSQFSEGSVGFHGGVANSVPFSAFGSLLQIVSPTAEDHILECALLFRRVKNDEQLILLTNDVTLKIKAMAEGLICETAEDFRESLVNPFSERFLWADSSPRGPTWSCIDDVVLREKYYRCPLKKLSKSEAAKGLKLILLHNSHYGKISLVS
ncbi:hypothetical protein F0562_002930 [Nyssa sinensis]|uniref:FHA domain-containing protein n=1 Tax=Nyssa sinensis TaxID=561372 RepID=A0A5J5BYJ0_9ASTE|nr:hypothetical protein F0562_002930 [Nyssa sinensis]